MIYDRFIGLSSGSRTDQITALHDQARALELLAKALRHEAERLDAERARDTFKEWLEDEAGKTRSVGRSWLVDKGKIVKFYDVFNREGLC
jgi:hypothetical protein